MKRILILSVNGGLVLNDRHFNVIVVPGVRVDCRRILHGGQFSGSIRPDLHGRRIFDGGLYFGRCVLPLRNSVCQLNDINIISNNQRKLGFSKVPFRPYSVIAVNLLNGNQPTMRFIILHRGDFDKV